jgi:hypothetical protein
VKTVGERRAGSSGWTAGERYADEDMLLQGYEVSVLQAYKFLPGQGANIERKKKSVKIQGGYFAKLDRCPIAL